MTSQQPPYDPDPPTATGAPYSAGSQPAGGSSTAQPPVRTVRTGPGWLTYLMTVLALLVLAAVIVFIAQNHQPINVKFFTWKHYFSRSSVALGASAVAGLIVGLFLGLIPWLSARRKIKALRRGIS